MNGRRDKYVCRNTFLSSVFQRIGWEEDGGGGWRSGGVARFVGSVGVGFVNSDKLSEPLLT